MLGYHIIALLLRRIFLLFSNSVRKGILSLQLVMLCKVCFRARTELFQSLQLSMLFFTKRNSNTTSRIGKES